MPNPFYWFLTILNDIMQIIEAISSEFTALRIDRLAE